LPKAGVNAHVHAKSNA